MDTTVEMHPSSRMLARISWVSTAGFGENCHVGDWNCFYRHVDLPADDVVPVPLARLVFCNIQKVFGPTFACGDVPNPTQH